MDIIIRRIVDYDDIEIFKRLTLWDNDPEIKHLIRPRMTEEELSILTVKEVMEASLANKSKHIYIVYDSDKLIASYSIDTNFDLCFNKNGLTAWLGLVIGDKNYRGKGIGRIMMESIEVECIKLGCDYIELGVFAFNKGAAKLYIAMGYEIIASIPNFVFHEGKWFDDIRMLKKL